MTRQDTIAQALRAIIQTGATFEIRIPQSGSGTMSGYYTDPELAARHVVRHDGRVPGIYVTPNPVVPACHARAADKLVSRAKATTGDADILCRRWILIDLDPVRPSGISSTDEELEASWHRAVAIREYLWQAGWGLPLLACSGNGHHLLYLIDLPNDDAARSLVQRCLAALAFLFDDAVVKVDQGVFNSARIWKLYGTLSCKGSNTPDRPHRVAAMLEVPELQQVSADQLQALAGRCPLPEPRRQVQGVATVPGEAFDLAGFIQRNGLPIVTVGSWQGGTRWVLGVCPWNEAHTNRSAWIAQFPSGAVAAGCHHNGCQGRKWSDLREMLEPRVVPLRQPQLGLPAPTASARPLADARPSIVTPQQGDRYLENTFLDRLPDAVWGNAIASEYVRRYGSCTEAPDAFHLAGFLGAVGIALGRSVWATQSRRIYPNLYLALIGDSGRGRKSTAMHMATEILKRLDPGVVTLKSIGSSEGLLEQLAEAEMTDEQKTVFRSNGTAPEVLHRRLLLSFDEISQFLVKSRKDASSSLIQTVVEAYDCPDQLDHSTRRQKLVALTPTLSFIGCSNAFWLERFSTLSDVLGGFSNRFLYVDGDRKPPMPKPPPPPCMNDIVAAVHGALAHYRQTPRELEFTAGADDLWARWYCECYELPTRTNTASILFQRAQVNAIKIATIYAALDRADAIEARHLEAGIGLVLYSGRVVAGSLGTIGEDAATKLERKILAYLQRTGARTARDVFCFVDGFATMKACREALESLVAGGVLAVESGRQYNSHRYRTVSDREWQAAEDAEPAEPHSSATGAR